MSDHPSRKDAVKKLGELISGIEVAMLTTAATDGSLHSRPMATQKAEFTGILWFFTKGDSAKTEEISHRQQVNLSYSEPKKQQYVTVSGTASLVRDQSKIKELWNPLYKAWFPDGLDDPQLALLKVEIDRAEYWDSQSSKIVQIIGFVKAIVTGKAFDPGEHEKINM